jgi:glucose/mannose-6-phosphate isomerase
LTVSEDNHINPIEPTVADRDEVAAALAALQGVDLGRMLDCVVETPLQIQDAVKAAETFHEGDLPLDRSRAHLVGLGGSAIAGELLRDMLAPRQLLEVHRGTQPPRDRCGVILSSYSGNTGEILELSRQVIGGLRTVVVLSSGGKLERFGFESGLPVWKMPAGYQPRAAVGWSLGLLAALLEKWRVTSNDVKHLNRAAHRLERSLTHEELADHPLVGASLPLANALNGRAGVIFHSLCCTGAAKRLAAQINENAKQPAFTVVVPEGMHNTVEGIGGADPDCWTLLFMSDQRDTSSLRVALNHALNHFLKLGFKCLPFPAAGDDSYERTLSRMVIADFTSLFLAAGRRVDPTPVNVIASLKQSDSEREEENVLSEDSKD